MEKYVGKSVLGGIALGKVRILDNNASAPVRYRVQNTEAELERLAGAIKEAKTELDLLYRRALVEVGEAGAGIFEIHKMLLEDEDYLEAADNIIKREQVNAEYAIYTTGNNFAGMFANMKDDYMKHRAADVLDVSNRVQATLGVCNNSQLSADEPAIIVAADLSPGQTISLDKSKILAFVTKYGSVNSHTAILAKMMNIPAIVGTDMDLRSMSNGTTAIVDGYNGVFVVNPEDNYIEYAKRKQEEEKEKQMLLAGLKGKADITADGHRINVYANISNHKDVGYVIENDAGGIGLFRSEFLYMGRNSFPSEEEQFQVYKQVLQTMAGKKVIIRTLDIGADKQVDYMKLGKEDNPAMGYRAIRICLSEPDIFKTQLRALFRAGVYGNLSIMYPMLASEWELDRIHDIANAVERELEAEGVDYAVGEQGIMIETPAAALISDRLAHKVDFFSIGTNDLTQYTLAIDRQNDRLEKFFDSHHEAVLRLIRLTIDNAHRAGIWAGICGELAADTGLTQEFLQMGVDELSVSPGMVLKLRKKIREISLKK